MYEDKQLSQDLMQIAEEQPKLNFDIRSRVAAYQAACQLSESYVGASGRSWAKRAKEKEDALRLLLGKLKPDESPSPA